MKARAVARPMPEPAPVIRIFGDDMGGLTRLRLTRPCRDPQPRASPQPPRAHRNRPQALRIRISFRPHDRDVIALICEQGRSWHRFPTWRKSPKSGPDRDQRRSWADCSNSDARKDDPQTPREIIDILRMAFEVPGMPTTPRETDIPDPIRKAEWGMAAGQHRHRSTGCRCCLYL
jgi:hypothetical protein